MHDDVAGFDVGAHASIRADGQALAAQSNRAFHLAVDVKIFAARQLALHDDRLADRRDVHAARRLSCGPARRDGLRDGAGV